MAKDVKPQLVAPYIRSYADQVRTATADLRTSIAAHGTAYDANNLSEVSLKLVSLAIDARQLLELSKVRGSPARTHATLAHQVEFVPLFPFLSLLLSFFFLLIRHAASN